MVHPYASANGFVSPQSIFQPPTASVSAPTKTIRGKASAKQQTEAAGKAKRKRPDTTERREAHNAMEKERRIALNGQFLDLARSVPKLADFKRPSKATIIVKATEHIAFQRDSRLIAAREVRAFVQQRDALLIQINQLRADQGLDSMAIPTEESDGVRKVLEVEEEEFGTFEAGSLGGDAEEEEEMTTDLAAGRKMEQTMFSFVQPMIAPPVELSYDFHHASIGDFPTTDAQDHSGSSSNQPNDTHLFLQTDFFPTCFPDDPCDSPISNPSLSSSLSQSFSSPHHLEVGSMFDVGIPPASDKVASWAAEGIFERIQQQKQQHQQLQWQHQPQGQFANGRGSVGQVEVEHVRQRVPTSFSAQYGGGKQHTSFFESFTKSQAIPAVAPPEQHFHSYCFPPSDPHPLPSPPSSLSGSFSSASSSNLDNLAWRELGLGQQQQQQLNGNRHSSNHGPIHSNTIHPVVHSSSYPGTFNGFGVQIPSALDQQQAARNRAMQQQQQQRPRSRDELREPTMDELREAVKIGMAHGASIVASVGRGSVGGGGGGGRAGHNGGAWGFEQRQQ